MKKADANLFFSGNQTKTVPIGHQIDGHYLRMIINQNIHAVLPSLHDFRSDAGISCNYRHPPHLCCHLPNLTSQRCCFTKGPDSVKEYLIKTFLAKLLMLDWRSAHRMPSVGTTIKSHKSAFYTENWVFQPFSWERDFSATKVCALLLFTYSSNDFRVTNTYPECSDRFTCWKV